MNDFLDNLGNDQHQKMLREIANDDLTPKKRDKKRKGGKRNKRSKRRNR